MFPFNLHKCSFYIFQKKFFGILLFCLKLKFIIKEKIAMKKINNLALIRDFLVDERLKPFLNYGTDSEVTFSSNSLFSI